MSDLFGNHIVGFPTRRLICRIHITIFIAGVVPGFFLFLAGVGGGGRGEGIIILIELRRTSVYAKGAITNF